MIIGNGMVATAFSQAGFDKSEITLFASGVSDSQCTDISQFKRESALLEKSLMAVPAAFSFVYFSTCSIYDPELMNSMYVLHKREMELRVLDSKNGVVIRLPQLAGANAPSNTLLSVVCSAIRENRPFNAWQNAYRNIIDICDVVKIADAILRERYDQSRIINIANPIANSIKDIIEACERVYSTDSMPIWLDKGSRYDIDTAGISHVIAELNINFDSRYLDRVIRRYYT